MLRTSVPLQGRLSISIDQPQQFFSGMENFGDLTQGIPTAVMETEQLQLSEGGIMASIEQGPFTEKDIGSPTHFEINLDANIATSTAMRSCAQEEVTRKHKRPHLLL